jgi:hypothetical protein
MSRIGWGGRSEIGHTLKILRVPELVPKSASPRLGRTHKLGRVVFRRSGRDGVGSGLLDRQCVGTQVFGDAWAGGPQVSENRANLVP